MQKYEKNDVKVSIIMPAYNAEAYIAASIESVVFQTYKNWELLVIDDCSSDSTQEIITLLSENDKRIKYYKNNENLGPARSRNRGLDLATGNYIAFLDSDDFWVEHKLRNQLDFMLEKGSVFSCTAMTMIDSNMSRVSRTFVDEIIAFKDLIYVNQVSMSTVVYDRLLFKLDRFPMIFHEDYALWLSILNRGLIFNGLNEELTLYTVRNDSVSGNKLRAAWYHWIIYRDFLGLSIPRSVVYFGGYALSSLYKYRSFFWKKASTHFL